MDWVKEQEVASRLRVKRASDERHLNEEEDEEDEKDGDEYVQEEKHEEYGEKQGYDDEIDEEEDEEEEEEEEDEKEEEKTNVLQEFTVEEVARHQSKGDCWVVLNNQVYDVTEFLPDHPGGKNAILLYGGKDATKEFNMLHKPEIIEKYGKQYHIGTLVVKSKL